MPNTSKTSLKITNLVLEDKRHVTPFVSDPKVFFFFWISFFRSFFLSSQSTPHLHALDLLSISCFFSFSSLSHLILSLFLFSFPFPGQILLSSLSHLFFSPLYFADGNPSAVADGSTNFNGITGFMFFFFFGRETGFGFNSNIVMEFWTLASVIGLRSFRFSWVSLWKRWRFLNNQTLSKGV